MFAMQIVTRSCVDRYLNSESGLWKVEIKSAAQGTSAKMKYMNRPREIIKIR